MYVYPKYATTAPTSTTAYAAMPMPAPPSDRPPGPAAILSVEPTLGAGSPSTRFSWPTIRPSRISRASSEWPTSSKASVASWPPTSKRTSSPPLDYSTLISTTILMLTIVPPREICDCLRLCGATIRVGMRGVGVYFPMVGSELTDVRRRSLRHCRPYREQRRRGLSSSSALRPRSM